jgi:hypothetical protein
MGKETGTVTSMMPRTVLTSSLLRTHPPTRMPRSWYVNDTFPARLDALAFLTVAKRRLNTRGTIGNLEGQTSSPA